MRYLGEDEATQVMGIGYPGELAQGADGNLYQWVQGMDGLGNPVGFWRRRIGQRRHHFPYRARPFLRRFVPIPMAPVVVPTPPVVCPTPPVMPAAVVTPEAMPAAPTAPPVAMPGAAPVAPTAAATAGWGLGEDELTHVMGLGYPGEVRTGPDGNLYQWVQGVDGLGNPVGWGWALKRLRKAAKRALPFVQRAASLIPGPYGAAVATALRAATPILQRAGVAGYNGLGALYQAPDGTLYQVQGLAEDEELRGLAEDEELRGFAEDEELRGLAEDEELRGLAEDEELRGFAEDEELRGFAQDEELRGLAEGEELQGLDQGYVREAGTSGLEAYLPEQPPQTRWFVPPAQPPEMWKPLW
jgi:hypothetical protein